MTIQRLGKDNVDVYTIETHASQSFFSGTMGAPITGSVTLMPSKLSGIKASWKPMSEASTPDSGLLFIEDVSFYDPGIFEFAFPIGIYDEVLAGLGLGIRSGETTFIESALVDYDSEDYSHKPLPTPPGGTWGAPYPPDYSTDGVDATYMMVANRAATAPYLTKSFDIKRLDSGYHLNRDQMKFSTVKNILMTRQPGNINPNGNFNFSYTNYHTLNFFTASSVGVQKYAGWDSSTEYDPKFPTGATGHDQSVLIFNNTRFWAGDPNERLGVFENDMTLASAGVPFPLPNAHPDIQNSKYQIRDFDRDFHTSLGTTAIPAVNLVGGLDNSGYGSGGGLRRAAGPPYTPYGDFTIDFYINPRYLQGDEKEYRAGTIMHISSTFAISLVSGSHKNSNNQADQFRIMLQLSHSAEFAPSSCSLSPNTNKGSTAGDPSDSMAMTNYPNDMIFLSNNNSLKHNHWHHVAIRWGTNLVNDGSGSFVIDGIEKGTFNIPSRSIFQLTFNDNGSHNRSTVTNPASRGDPNALFIGNFMEGTNHADWLGAPEQIRYFFNTASVEFENINHHPEVTTPRSPYAWRNQVRRGQPQACVDKIDVSGVADGNQINLHLSEDLGGDGENINIIFKSSLTGTPPWPAIWVKRESADSNTRDNLILAFNGTSDTAKVKFDSGAGTTSDGVAGCIAYEGTTNKRVTIRSGDSTTNDAYPFGSYSLPFTIEKEDEDAPTNLVRNYPTFESFTADTTGLPPGPYGVTPGIYPEDNEPKTLTFNHPLRAEIHEIKIHDVYKTSEEIIALSKEGPKDLSNILFYLPPFFVMDSPMRRFVKKINDVGLDGTYWGDDIFPGASNRDGRWRRFAIGPGIDPEGTGDLFGSTLYTGSNAPFNIQLADQVAALSVSVENFTRELVRGQYPRLYHLTESYCGLDSHGKSTTRISEDNKTGHCTSNEFFNSVPVNNKRNFLIMPNDNGLFAPNFNLLASGTYDNGAAQLTAEVIMGHLSGSVTGTIDQPYGRFVNDQNIIDLSQINLNNLVDGGMSTSHALRPKSSGAGFGNPGTLSDVSTSGRFPRQDELNRELSDSETMSNLSKHTGPAAAALTMVVSSSALSDTVGIPGIDTFTPNPNDFLNNQSTGGDASNTWEDMATSPCFGATGDKSSNMVSLFSISNLYYGDKIDPGTFSLIEENFTGSNGTMKLTLKDDGTGGIYRADSLTPHATWNNVGNIFYNEGIIFIKSPHIYRVGTESFEVGLKGHRDVHVMTVSVPCPAGQINVSNNPTYEDLAPSLDPNETADKFVYITGIDLHDDNLNVIARATLAQPLMKRISDEFLFKIKIDF